MSQHFTSTHITEDLMIANADGDSEEATAIVGSWKPQFRIVTIEPDNPALQEPITFEG